MDLLALVLILLSALLWGATDALIKLASPPQLLREPRHDDTSSLRRLGLDFLALVQSPAYLACQALNQCGSLLYYYTLSFAPLSVVAPAVNTGKLVINLLG